MVPEGSEQLDVPVLSPPEPLTRGRALAEVVLCSGYPTQLVLAATLVGVFRMGPGPGGSPSALFMVALLALDTVLLLTLIFFFLRRSHDAWQDVFLGTRPVAGEIRLGLLTVPALLLSIVAIQLVLRAIAPWLDNVPDNPFAELMNSPLALAGFVVVLIVAGGLREELQRAFLLKRFEQHLGGARLGLLVTSLAFGLGHTIQGWDAALVTAVLGALWGALYLARRSVAATVTSHAVFNAVEATMGYLSVAN